MKVIIMCDVFISVSPFEAGGAVWLANSDSQYSSVHDPTYYVIWLGHPRLHRPLHVAGLFQVYFGDPFYDTFAKKIP